MTKAQLASLIDAYADAKGSGNKYLIQTMISQLEDALNQVCAGEDPGPAMTSPTEVVE